jgi:hypothetical protein
MPFGVQHPCDLGVGVANTDKLEQTPDRPLALGVFDPPLPPVPSADCAETVIGGAALALPTLKLTLLAGDHRL